MNPISSANASSLFSVGHEQNVPPAYISFTVDTPYFKAYAPKAHTNWSDLHVPVFKLLFELT